MFLIDKIQSIFYRFKRKKFPQPAKCCVASIFIILILFNPAITLAESIIAREYHLKAAFLYNFARLVDWPSKAFINPDSSIQLCLIGNNPFGQALKTIEGKKVKKRTFDIIRSVSLEQISKCHLLFIGSTEEHSLAEIMNITRQYPILTISEEEGFPQKSGHIRFYLTKGETLSIEVNLEAINKADLQMSSRILSLATIVQTEGAKKQ